MTSHYGKYSRPWVRSGAIVGVVDFLQRNGYDPAEIVGKTNMKMFEAADMYRQVNLISVMEVFKKAADITGRPDIGLELGEDVALDQLGPFGFLYMNARTIGDALNDYVRFGPAFQTQAHFGLTRGQKRFCLEYSSNHPEMPGWEHDGEVTVGYMIGIVNKLARKRVIPDEVHFEHAPVCEMSDYARILSVRPSFDRGMNRIYYPLDLLDQTIPDANPNLYIVLRRHMEDLAASIPGESALEDVIRNNIRRGLGSNAVSLEHIASELGIEPRTLQRKLVKSGTSFQKIFDQVRLELALYYLQRTTMDVTQIALELGYAESSVFSRAFKRWTGKAPGYYRKEKSGTE